MKKIVFIFALVVLCVCVSCSSTESKLKNATVEINELTEKMKKAESLTEAQNLAVKYKKIIESLEKDINNISSEELMKIEGSEDFIQACNKFNQASSETSLKLAGKGIEAVGNIANSFNF